MKTYVTVGLLLPLVTWLQQMPSIWANELRGLSERNKVKKSNDSVKLHTQETDLDRSSKGGVGVTRTMRKGGKGGTSFDDSHEYGDFGKISYI